MLVGFVCSVHLIISYSRLGDSSDISFFLKYGFYYLVLQILEKSKEGKVDDVDAVMLISPHSDDDLTISVSFYHLVAAGDRVLVVCSQWLPPNQFA